jgi:hypothetical protein
VRSWWFSKSSEFDGGIVFSRFNKTTEPKWGVWISLEPETQSVLSRTKRYSEWTALSRIVLRAARSAPTQFIAELKRSADLFGIVFVWFQFPELFSTSFSFRTDYRPSCWFWLSQVVVWLSESVFWSRDFFRNANFTGKNFSKTGRCREAAKISKNGLKSPKNFRTRVWK